MIYRSEELEKSAVLHTAAQICAAARTAPKAKGVDGLKTCVLTGEDKDRLAQHMRGMAERLGYAFFLRDAGNIDSAEAVVLFGMEESQRGLGDGCGYCHHKNCAECAEKNGLCAYDAIDLGIAIGSAAATAADMRVDNRILFSAGRAAMEMKLLGDATLVLGLPLSTSGKSPFFDRKKN